MSLIFEALKKSRRAATFLGSAKSPVFVLRVPEQPRVSPVLPMLPGMPGYIAWPWLGLVLAMLTGMLLTGGGVLLYTAGQKSPLKLSSNVEPAQTAIMAKPREQEDPVVASELKTVDLPSTPVVLTPTPVETLAAAAPPLVTVTAVFKPDAAATTVALASARSSLAGKISGAKPTAGVAMDPSVKTLTPEPPTQVKPEGLPSINSQVQLSIDANSFDVREAFQAFVQLLQMGKLPESQMVADKITTALGGSHVMSLRAQGYLAFKKNDLSKAKIQYLQLQQLLPEDREAGLNLGLIDWRQGEKDAAAKRVARLLEKFPNDPEIQAFHFNVRNP